MTANLGVMTGSVLLITLLLQAPLLGKGKEEAFLKLVPGGVVTLDMVVGLGYKYSDQIQIMKADRDAKDLPVLKAKSQLAGKISTSLTTLRDQSQPIGPFSPSSNDTQKMSLSWSQAFRTGTQITSSFNTQQSDIAFDSPGFTELPKYQSEFTLSARQSLLRNSFGNSTRKLLEAAQLSADGIEWQFHEQLGQWFLQVESIYRQAWLAQKSVEYSRERIATQKRLLKVIQLSLRRGTAEEADVLNVRQNLIRVEQAYLQAKKNLGDIWRQLVIVLKLPENMLDFDPEKIPLKESVSTKDFNRMCSKKGRDRVLDRHQARFASIRKNIDALSLNLQVWDDALKPDVYLQASAGSNGVNDELQQTFTDSLSHSNPKLSVLLGVDITLGQYDTRAEILAAKRDQTKLRHALASKEGEVLILWTNTCEQVKQLQGDQSLFQRMLELNIDRNKMEEKRFSLGKVDVQAVILSANDIILSQEALARTQAGIMAGVWQLKEISGEVKSYVDKAMKGINNKF